MTFRLAAVAPLIALGLLWLGTQRQVRQAAETVTDAPL